MAAADAVLAVPATVGQAMAAPAPTPSREQISRFVCGTHPGRSVKGALRQMKPVGALPPVPPYCMDWACFTTGSTKQGIARKFSRFIAESRALSQKSAEDQAGVREACKQALDAWIDKHMPDAEEAEPAPPTVLTSIGELYQNLCSSTVGGWRPGLKLVTPVYSWKTKKASVQVAVSKPPVLHSMSHDGTLVEMRKDAPWVVVVLRYNGVDRVFDAVGRDFHFKEEGGGRRQFKKQRRSRRAVGQSLAKPRTTADEHHTYQTTWDSLRALHTATLAGKIDQVQQFVAALADRVSVAIPLVYLEVEARVLSGLDSMYQDLVQPQANAGRRSLRSHSHGVNDVQVQQLLADGQSIRYFQTIWNDTRLRKQALDVIANAVHS